MASVKITLRLESISYGTRFSFVVVVVVVVVVVGYSTDPLFQLGNIPPSRKNLCFEFNRPAFQTYR